MRCCERVVLSFIRFCFLIPGKEGIVSNPEEIIVAVIGKLAILALLLSPVTWISATLAYLLQASYAGGNWWYEHIRIEIGHLVGLKHCRDFGCLMHRADTVEDIDVRGAGFCSACHPAFPPGLLA